MKKSKILEGNCEISTQRKLGIAIAGMLYYMAVDFLGTIVSAELFPGEAVLEVILGQICICCFSDRYGVQHRVQLYDAEYEQRKRIQS